MTVSPERRLSTARLVIEFCIEALRRLGEQLRATPRAGGTLFRGTELEPREREAPTLAEIGIDKMTSAVAQKLAELPLAISVRGSVSERQKERRVLFLPRPPVLLCLPASACRRFVSSASGAGFSLMCHRN